MTQLPVQPAWRRRSCRQLRWLVDRLWSNEAFGIIGGELKCGKSFLALDLVAVAAGIPCLRRFVVSRPGRVLLYPAEDALYIVRRRREGICAAAVVSLADPDVQVITAPSRRPITAALADAGQPKPFADLRSSCRVRTSLAAMTAASTVVKSADGYCLAAC
jgi:hypothetical protein